MITTVGSHYVYLSKPTRESSLEVNGHFVCHYMDISFVLHVHNDYNFIKWYHNASYSDYSCNLDLRLFLTMPLLSCVTAGYEMEASLPHRSLILLTKLNEGSHGKYNKMS